MGGGAEAHPADLVALDRSFGEALAAAASPQALADLKARMFGRRGPLGEALRGLPALPPAQRRRHGEQLNRLKASWAAALKGRHEALSAQAAAARPPPPPIDVTLPGRRLSVGAPHPAQALQAEIVEILAPWGFEEVVGPQVEHDWYNFTALNMPPDHPARDMQDTFFVADDVVLRTHTSNVQIRTLLQSPPPVRVVAPGMVFRRDEVDATHSPVFHQVEGLWVDDQVSFADLKGVLTHLVMSLFGDSARLRFRPSYFPFTEPSCECDVSCRGCGPAPRQDCRICRGSGWLEVLGAGMVDPAVLTAVGLDPERLTGFAFGLGVERIALLRHDIADMRDLFDNDLRLLQAAAGLSPAGARPPA